MDALPVFLWAFSGHSSFWLGLSSPYPYSAGIATREHMSLHASGSSFSLSQLKLWLICRHINSGWEWVIRCKTVPKQCGLQEGSGSGQKRACYPWTQGKQSQHSLSHKSGNTAVGADIFSHSLFFFWSP